MEPFANALILVLSFKIILVIVLRLLLFIIITVINVIFQVVLLVDNKAYAILVQTHSFLLVMELLVVVHKDIYYKIIHVCVLLDKLVATVHVLHALYLTVLNVIQLTYVKFVLTPGHLILIKLNAFVINCAHFLEAVVYVLQIISNIIMFVIIVNYLTVFLAVKMMYVENANLLSYLPVAVNVVAI